MNAAIDLNHAVRYARCIEISKRIRWEIDRDVIRGRQFDFRRKFLPDRLSRVREMGLSNAEEQRLMSQIQGRTYANMLSLVERFINAEILEISRAHWLGDQTALEALVRFSDEELKHQELFRRIERMIAGDMPEGYTFLPDPNQVAARVLGKSTWAILALTCHIELCIQAHYRESMDADAGMSELYRDVFLFHWREESQHVILDELEWGRENARLDERQRERAVDELIELVQAMDGLLQTQAAADADYFLRLCGHRFSTEQSHAIHGGMLRAYRWQYIGSGIEESRFLEILGRMISVAQARRIHQALVPLL
ncbi:MAG TPA: hypothetical protein VNN09_01020 [Candidatus Competibacteraceae bacterium]|nr:hypothetical protein [Candidatus Competibacteraceae bacterium]